ncbi:phage major capsid protein [Pseudoflavonifractor capillosus]|uniref:phage major capsid protein n=1 Tax=Pseudoflavonifractor capillosus TaxID=106588 RepID=UPI001955FE49|nr:phage major capsid protein [Pseudoflavonifractor capillosus]
MKYRNKVNIQFFAQPSNITHWGQPGGADDRLDAIEARMSAIAQELEQPGADLDALEAEVRSLKDERTQITQAAERRAQILREVSAGGGTVIRTFDQGLPEKRSYTPESAEYRSLWLRSLQGQELTDVEKRAYTTANGAIATMTANAIMEVVRDHAPLLERMTVIYSPSTVTYYVEGTNNAAEDHTENAAISAAADTLTKITLVPAEIVKLIQIGEATRTMSVDAFEAWLAKNLGEAIARKINEKIIAAIVAAASSAGSDITTASVQALLGSVKGIGVAVICNRKTLYTKLLPLQDNSKSSIVRFDGGSASVYGVEVLPDDNVADNTVLAGDLSKAIGAMSENVTVRKGYDIDSNSNKYLGVAVFDVKIGQNSAFAKLTKA